MYDELVKALHNGAEFLECSTPGIKNSFAKMCHNAAEAIEELSRAAEQMKAIVIDEAQHAEMFDERDKQTLMEMAKSLPLQIIPNKDEKPRWIPVTEALPEESEGLNWH